MASALFEFPFVDDFSRVFAIDGGVGRLRPLVLALEPIIDHLVAAATKDRSKSSCVLPALLYAVAARARIDVVLAYEYEVREVEQFGVTDVVLAMQLEWQSMVARDRMVFSQCTDSVIALLTPVVSTVWRPVVEERVTTAEDLLLQFGALVDDVKVVSVGDVLVASEKGTCINDLEEAARLKPVLTVVHYRRLLSDLSAKNGEQFGSDISEYSMWEWLVVASKYRDKGYCYQNLFHPALRHDVCVDLGAFPLSGDVNRSWLELHGVSSLWTGVLASFEVVDTVCHIRSPGVLVLHELLPPDVCVGGEPDQVDYFARALLDDFFMKHKRRDSQQPESFQAPVDKEFGALSLQADVRRRSGFERISAEHYALVGEAVSPQLTNLEFAAATSGDSTGAVSARDNARLVELCDRLDSGGVIPEDYFDRTRARFVLGRRRPAIEQAGGQVYHVFSGFKTDEGGAGLGVWQRDMHWNIPGWESYIAVFKPGITSVLSFVSPHEINDVRMDCTGDGDIYLGQCAFPVHNTVLWFTHSLRFELRVRARTVLRMSLPQSGSASAIGLTMRRYMHLPGYTIAAKRFSVIENRESTLVTLKRERSADVHAGCHIYSGTTSLIPGKHRIRVSGLRSSEPIKLLVKTDPVESLTYVGVCGIRIEPRSRDYASVLFDIRDGDLTLTLRHAATVKLSVLQIAQTREFDAAIRGRAKSSVN